MKSPFRFHSFLSLFAAAFAFSGMTQINAQSPTPAPATTAPAPKPAPKPQSEPAPVGIKLPEKAEAGTIRTLIVGGGSSHNFDKWFNEADSATLKAAGGFVTAYSPSPSEVVEQLKNADVLVLSTNHPAFDNPEFHKALEAFAAAGKGIILLHPGTWYAWGKWADYNKTFVGGGARSHDSLGPFTVNVKAASHPIMKGVPATFEVKDELYQVNLDPAAAKAEVLAETSVSKKTGKAHPSVWTVANDKAKIVCIALGHDGDVHNLQAYKTILTNAVHWAAGK